MLYAATDRTAPKYSAGYLQPKLHVVDTSVAEGFFASVVVLVEGPSDRAALVGAASLAGHSFEAEEIAVITVGGKSNLDKAVAVFRSLGIPVFTMWDCDRKKIAETLECNHKLQRLHGVLDTDLTDAMDAIRDCWACFEHDLEAKLTAELGKDRWERHLDALKVEFGVSTRTDAQKAPLLMTRLLAAAADEGSRSTTMDDIVTAIRALRPPLYSGGTRSASAVPPAEEAAVA